MNPYIETTTILNTLQEKFPHKIVVVFQENAPYEKEYINYLYFDSVAELIKHLRIYNYDIDSHLRTGKKIELQEHEKEISVLGEGNVELIMLFTNVVTKKEVWEGLCDLVKTEF